MSLKPSLEEQELLADTLPQAESNMPARESLAAASLASFNDFRFLVIGRAQLETAHVDL
jgi:hypothetical protein